MKNIKRNPQYQLFVNALGWYLNKVNADPRIRLAMLVIQAITFHYARRTKRTLPITVEETMTFLDGTMKERRQGKDDQLLDTYTMLLASIKGIVDSVDYIKTNSKLASDAFWDFLLIDLVAERGRYTMELARTNDLVRDEYAPTLEQAFRTDIDNALTAAGHPNADRIRAGKTLINAISIYRDCGMLDSPAIKSLIENFSFDIKDEAESGIADEVFPDTADQPEQSL